MVIKHIVLAGGAYKGLYELGALKYLSNSEFYSIGNIKSIHGTSIGGLVGTILSLDIPWETIDEYVIKRPWYKITNVSPMMLLDILPKKGLLGYDFFKSVLEPLLHSKELDVDINLKDFYEITKINLCLYTINLNTFELVQISHKTFPEMELIKAVNMTCCLPYIFQPVWHEDSYYIDGGLINNYPIDYAILSENIEDNREILGITFDTNETDNNLSKESNIFEYGYYIYKKMVMRPEAIVNTIPYELIIPCKELNVDEGYKTLVNSESRAKYIEDGENFAKIFHNMILKE